jgi:hypothetical protein
MRTKIPGHYIFRHLNTKTLGQFTTFVKQCGWQDNRRYYKASVLIRAIILYYLKQLPSLDALVAFLKDNRKAAAACGFDIHIPSRATFSRFLNTAGDQPFEDLFYGLLKNLQSKGIG